MISETWRFGRIEVRPAERVLLVDSKAAKLGARAFDLLLALVERRDRIVAKNELLDTVWPGLVVEENNLQVHISTLRKLLGPQVIATVPGRGYRFTAAPDDSAARHAVAAVSAAAPAASWATPSAASAVAATAPLTNLPADLPPLYGRDEDLPALRALIEAHKVVTVVGAGGIGKTALAQALAHQLRGEFEDGVWLVELAPVADATLVATTVAGVLRVELGAAAPIETLARELAASRMLLVLDNCEHLLLAVAELVSALRRAAPNVQLLATSQEPLKVAQEHAYRLSALALPAEAGIESARQAGAVALFEARARAAQPQFALNEKNLAAVVEVCRRLDGIALAIELAAARVPLLGIEGLRARLNERFRVLTGGARLALRRHQTLRAALDWSHGLLTHEEQTVFRRLGVFAGSFGLDSAQRVTADRDSDEWEALDRLGALVDKSLVVAEAGTEPRYRLLETNRAFAMEKLQEAGETESALRNHAQAVLAVFEESRANEFVLSTEQRLDRYLPDLDNVRAALDWAAGAAGDRQLHIALAGAIAWIWVSAGLRPEGLRRTQLAMDNIDSATPPQWEARLRGSWSLMAHPAVGALEIAADARAIELYRALGNRQALLVALCQRARVLSRCQQFGEAEVALQEAVQIHQADWPPMLRAILLNTRGWVLFRQGRFEAADRVTTEAVQLVTALGERRMALTLLIGREQAAAGLGRWEESVARGRELVARMQQERSLRTGIENIVLGNLSMALAQVGQVEEALLWARRAYPTVEQAGRVLDLLDPFAVLAFKRGQIDDAARIVGRAVIRYATSTYQREMVEQKLHDDLLRTLRETLAPAALTR